MAFLLMTFLFILGLVVQSTIAFSSIRNNIIGSRLNTDIKLKLKSSATLNDIPTKSTQQQPIERVAIIGAGIAGLSLAHALRSTNLMNDDGNAKPIQIDIFDSRQDLDEKSGSGELDENILCSYFYISHIILCTHVTIIQQGYS